MKVKNAQFDAIDFDFSNVKVEKLQVANAGNDCVDLSKGEYEFDEVDLKNCGDKAVSVGEMSELNVLALRANTAKIGVSVKDYSLFRVGNIVIKDALVCAEAKQKKQEFGGGKIIFGEIDCDGRAIQDENSTIIGWKQ